MLTKCLGKKKGKNKEKTKKNKGKLNKETGQTKEKRPRRENTLETGRKIEFVMHNIMRNGVGN